MEKENLTKVLFGRLDHWMIDKLFFSNQKKRYALPRNDSQDSEGPWHT